jgi:hypothetical protein
VRSGARIEALLAEVEPTGEPTEPTEPTEAGPGGGTPPSGAAPGDGAEG